MNANTTDSTFSLRSCLWELTLRCNMRCMHCGSVAGAERQAELSFDECMALADEIIDIGCEDLTFIGGEVLIYPRWEYIARHLSDAGVLVNIMSNGYKVREKHIRQIKYARLTNVGISIDGMEENHNRIRRKPNGFAEAAKTLGLLDRENISSGVVTTLLDFNFPDLERMYDFFVEKGVEVWQLQLANPMGNLAGKNELTIDPNRIPSLTRFIREKNRERKMMVIGADSVGYYDENENYIRGRRAAIPCWVGCQAGINSVFIDSIGNVKGCGALYSEIFIEGNVRDRRLAEIWNDESCFSYNRNFSTELLSGRCKDCEFGAICKGGCRASNFFSRGSLYENHYCSRNHTTADCFSEPSVSSREYIERSK